MPSGVRAGHPTCWQVFGTGQRPALAVHCMLGHCGAWTRLGVALADRLTLTAFDLPGHGQSGDYDPACGIEYQRLATQIAASFIDRPVDLIGHSFGAGVALRLAVAAPEAVRSLTLIEPVLFAAVRHTPEGQDEAAAHARFDAEVARDPEAAARAFLDRWGTGTPWEALAPAQRAALVARIGLVDLAGHANVNDPGTILRDGGLEAIDAPVMMILGADSPPVIHRVAEALADRLPDVGRATVPGAGHMLPLTHVAQVADLIGLNLDRS